MSLVKQNIAPTIAPLSGEVKVLCVFNRLLIILLVDTTQRLVQGNRRVNLLSQRRERFLIITFEKTIGKGFHRSKDQLPTKAKVQLPFGPP